MTVSVRAIATAVPATVLHQPDVKEIFAAQPGLTRLGRRRISAVFDASAIDTRHTVVDELGPATEDACGEPVFYNRTSTKILEPSTGTRNEVYVRHAPGLFLSAAQGALSAAAGVSAADVTHVVTVSCTGFFAPGPDYLLVRGLGLDAATQRYHLGFMGCYGAFPALRMARSFCRADPDAVVLVVCAELCTIHLRSDDDPDTILASSVFADGAAAAVVTAQPAPVGATVLDLDAFETTLTPVGEADMAWTIGDLGFEMTLSGYVPRIISEHIRDALAPLLASEQGLAGQPYSEIDRWAVHPGGRSIVDKVQQHLGLSADQLRPSREVLRRYGNMSSATVLFVLAELLADTAARENERVCAMAFGPGLTVESALMTRRVVT